MLLAGCVSNRIDVVETGVRPDLAGRGLALAPAVDGEPDLARPVGARLEAAGLPVREAPGQGYLVEVSYSERPLKVGAYAGPRPAADAEPAAWVAPPQTRRWWWAPQRVRLCTLSARVVDAASGGEAYRVRASARGRQPDCGEAGETLSAAVAAKLAATP
ncbi:hypothetical protein [Phenylobacterium sp.]|uniref:hypothetical protein n=1 Tax=Phenylobacterium sp. TaxID=1871053 RepID=UPI0028995193|nr:hypothetical protein [Phenylobacterium sp.]